MQDESDHPPLRDRLLALRADVLRQLAEGEAIDGGLLALLGNVGAAIAAIDAMSETGPVGNSRRRGGHAKAQPRARRNAALCDYAELLGAELSLEHKAQQIISKAGRYRPGPTDNDGSAERRALHRIAETGLPVPGPRQLKRILNQP